MLKSLSTTQVVLRIIGIISISEFLIMLLIGNLPNMDDIYVVAVLDFFLLAMISTPLIYLWVIEPFVVARDGAIAQINLLAETDSLTQLPNRRLLSSRLEAFMAAKFDQKLRGALLLMDLDGFKSINDEHGHDAGDAVLVEVAARLCANIRSEDFVARLGGDEFIILVHNLEGDHKKARARLDNISTKLLDVVTEPFLFEGRCLNFGASIGVRFLDSGDMDTQVIMREADVAMYRAKEEGRGRVEFFCEAV